MDRDPGGRRAADAGVRAAGRAGGARRRTRAHRAHRRSGPCFGCGRHGGGAVSRPRGGQAGHPRAARPRAHRAPAEHEDGSAHPLCLRSRRHPGIRRSIAAPRPGGVRRAAGCGLPDRRRPARRRRRGGRHGQGGRQGRPQGHARIGAGRAGSKDAARSPGGTGDRRPGAVRAQRRHPARGGGLRGAAAGVASAGVRRETPRQSTAYHHDVFPTSSRAGGCMVWADVKADEVVDMPKDKKDRKEGRIGNDTPAGDGGEQGEKPGLKRKDYESKLRELHVKLVALQEWVRHEAKKICIVFEGRDGAGKGGAIKAITARVSPRVFRVVALPAPTEREKSQMYVQRYLPHLPAGGEVVIFDRSWYNRAGVERVMGFCTEEEAKRFLRVAPQVEKTMVDSGIILLKYWLEVSPQEQEMRLKARIDDGRKTWKLSKMDLKSFARWDDYTHARDEMLRATDTAWAPWFVARSDDKRRARLNIIEHLLANIPYERVPRAKVKLPARHVATAHRISRLPLKVIAEVH